MGKRLSDTPKLVTRRELAQVHGVHLQTISKWEQQGLPVAEPGSKGRPSKFDPDAVAAWLKAREDAAEKSGVADLARERALRERAQRIAREQATAREARQLIPRAEAEKALTDEVLRMRAALLGWERTLPHRIARAYELEGERGVARELRSAVEEILNELAKTDDLQDAVSAPAPPEKPAKRKPTRKKATTKKKRSSKKRAKR